MDLNRENREGETEALESWEERERERQQHQLLCNIQVQMRNGQIVGEVGSSQEAPNEKKKTKKQTTKYKKH